MKKIIAALVLVSLVLGMGACAKTEEKPISVEDIHAICELATMKCFYNNVAKYEKKADNIFQVDREMWIEYEGVVILGIQMENVVIKTKGDKVYITLPKAEILDWNYTINKDSIICSTDGWLVKNKITTEEQQEAVTASLENMLEEVRKNDELFLKAELRAKELIEGYVLKFGEATGQEYTIVWKN